MRFTPKKEEELSAFKLLDHGIYDFIVKDAKEKISKSGNEMIELSLIVYDNTGREYFIYDYLLESMGFKLRHFCEEVGLLDDYESGLLNSIKCIGKKGKIEIEIQTGQQKPTGGYYPDKNRVKDYAIYIDKEGKKDKELNDDIPF